MQNNNPFESAKTQMQSAYQFLSWKYEKEFASLLAPERVIEVSIPVVMDSGEPRVFTGYRSQHSGARGPYKGGIRYHQDVTKDEVMALSAWMSIKTATLDLPLGGGKWGIIVDPKTLTEKELESLSRGWVQKLYKYLWPNVDIPAPDVNTNGKIMSWMVDEYSRLVGEWSPGTFTGKPLSIGGSLGRDTATAQGGLYALMTYLESRGESLSGKTVVIQWAWNAGLNMMELVIHEWAKVIALSDSRWGIYDANGLDVEKITKLKSEKKSLAESGIKTITNAEILELACDILIPAALENQITEFNAKSIQAKIVLELANGPTTPKADDILFARGITVIPDILANAGGVTVSYFEQVQNNTNYFWSREEVMEKLKAKMEKATHWVIESATKNGVMFRTGAYIIALERILEAMKTRGM